MTEIELQDFAARIGAGTAQTNRDRLRNAEIARIRADIARLKLDLAKLVRDSRKATGVTK